MNFCYFTHFYLSIHKFKLKEDLKRFPLIKKSSENLTGSKYSPGIAPAIFIMPKIKIIVLV